MAAVADVVILLIHHQYTVVHVISKKTCENLFTFRNSHTFDNFSREFEVCQNNANKSGNFSCEIKVCQNNVNKSGNFSCEIEVGQNNANKSDNFSCEFEVCQNNINKSLKSLQKLAF